jgi:hypothetical protein
MPAQGPPPQEYARVVLIVILLFFIYNSPDQGVPAGFPGSSRDYVADQINRMRHNLHVLNDTRWQDFAPYGSDTEGQDTKYLNLTGFREHDEFAWDRLATFKKRSDTFSDQVKGRWRIGKDFTGLEGEIYENVTGVVNGRWIRYDRDLPGEEIHRQFNLSETSPGIDWAFRDEEYWTRNVTGKEGKMMLRVDERDVEQLDTNAEDTLITEADSWSGGLVREVAATMTIQDESSSGDGYEMRIHGVHWPKQGTMLLTTTSEKFAGIFGLPHLTTQKDYFDTSQQLLNGTLGKTVERMEKSVWLDPSNPWSSTPDAQGDATMPAPHCEYVVYVQVHPVDIVMSLRGGSDFLDFAPGTAATMVSEIEQELRFPNGAPLPKTPRLQMSTVIFSPDCGFILESKGPPDFSSMDGEHLTGSKQEVWLHDIHSWLLGLAAVVFGQIILLKIQSKEASTPSTVGRVSLYTIGMMLMVDALLFSSLSLLSATAPNIFPSALLASFSSLMSVALGVRFIGAVYSVQEPERRAALEAETAAAEANRPPQSSLATTANTLPIPIAAAGGIDILPITSTGPPPAASAIPDAPIIVPSDQDVEAEITGNIALASTVFIPTSNSATLPTTNLARPAQPRAGSVSNFGAIYVKFVLFLTLLLFVSLSAISWPVPIRTAYVHFLSMIYLSFWLPQIRRNVIRNCRKALLWKFIVGQSILRLLPFAYFYLKKDNFLFAETDWVAFTVYAGWVWIQIWILVAQEVLGPRWGLPKGWTEEGWDYHPILKEDNVEAGGLPIGLVKVPGSPTLERAQTSEDLGGSKKNDGGTRTVDCVICKEILEVHVVASGVEISGTSAAGGVAGMLARRLYMVTPCRHIFHSHCLEDWMRFRLQCPICRENLPPL